MDKVKGGDQEISSKWKYSTWMICLDKWKHHAFNEVISYPCKRGLGAGTLTTIQLGSSVKGERINQEQGVKSFSQRSCILSVILLSQRWWNITSFKKENCKKKHVFHVLYLAMNLFPMYLNWWRQTLQDETHSKLQINDTSSTENFLFVLHLSCSVRLKWMLHCTEPKLFLLLDMKVSRVGL